MDDYERFHDELDRVWRGCYRAPVPGGRRVHGSATQRRAVFAERYERSSLRISSNLPFGEWGSVFQGERMTAALLDRLTHRCHIFEINGESYRFRESAKTAKEKRRERNQSPSLSRWGRRILALGMYPVLLPKGHAGKPL